jgi:hypothetical protein
MSCLSTLLLSAFPLGAAPVPSPPGPVEKLLRAYCDRHGLDRKQLEPWPSALAPEGRVFRYKLRAVPAEGGREALAERYALVFVDPDAGNVYDVKQTPGKGCRADPADRRLWAVLRLMGTTAGDDKRAAAVMADLYRARAVLGSARDEPRFTVRVTAVRKGETWADPAVTYTGTFVEAGLHLVMKVDEEGYVTEFYVLNIR